MPAFASLILVTLLLWVAEYAYTQFGRKRGFLEPVTFRSTHREANAVRAGGFIFPVAVIAAWFCGFRAPWFIGAVIAIGAVSMADDFHPLPDWLRLLVQVGAMVAVCIQLGASNLWMWGGIALLGVALMNAFNFMDGINGMTALYGASVVVPLIIIGGWLPANPIASVLPFMLPPLLVFGWCNIRRKPICFAGDVGAVSIGLVIAAVLSGYLCSNTGAWGLSEFLFLLSLVLVYGVDTALTLLMRIAKGENIRQAHRSHLYQLLVNEAGYGPVAVSAVYSLVQLLVDAAMIYCAIYGVVVPGFIVVTALLCADYLYIRRRLGA